MAPLRSRLLRVPGHAQLDEGLCSPEIVGGVVSVGMQLFIVHMISRFSA
jgi:hypothetical protein